MIGSNTSINTFIAKILGIFFEMSFNIFFASILRLVRKNMIWRKMVEKGVRIIAFSGISNPKAKARITITR